MARILKYTIRECRDMEITDIISCIDDDIEVAASALDPGLTNLGKVREDKTEDSVPGEGTIYYDIRFSAYLGQMKMKFLINLEAQKLTSHSVLGYHTLIAMLEVLLSEMKVEEKKDILEKEYGMVIKLLEGYIL